MAALDLETRLVVALIAAGVLDGNVGTRLPRDFAERLPYGTLHRVPGSRYADGNTETLEAGRLQVNTRADDELVAFAAMSSLLEGIKELQGTGLGPTAEDPPDVFVTNVDTSPPWWNPDPESECPGYQTNVTVFIKGYRSL